MIATKLTATLRKACRKLLGQRSIEEDNTSRREHLSVQTLQEIEARDGQSFSTDLLATLFADGTPSLPQMTIETPPEGCLFKRTYECDLGSMRISMSATTWFGERNYSATLTLDDGFWVVFDPRHPSDRIFQHSLVMAILPACEAMVAEDRRYLASDEAKSFIDTAGFLWIRSEDPVHTQ